MTETGLCLAVIMERRRLANKWADCQWEAVGVVPDGGREAVPRLIYQDEHRAQWLFPGFSLQLYTDEAEGYIGNVTSPEPRLFVMWRLEEGLARPVLITVSYAEAARMMDASEQVDGVPLPADIREWVAGFAARHYRPEPKHKGRHADSRKREG